MHLGTLGEVEKASILDSRPPLECLSGDYDHLYGPNLTLQFKFNYMNVVDFDNPVFSHLIEMVKEANDMNIKMFAYLNPINVKDGIKYVGQDFSNRFLGNTKIVREFLKKNNVDYLDLSTYLGPKYFVDKRYTSEHVNIVGKQLVAERLAKELVSKRLIR